MFFASKLLKSTVALVVAFAAVMAVSTPAMAISPSPPAGQVLHAYGYFNTNSQNTTLNPSDASATLVNPGVGPSALEYSEGAGYDAVTGKTWLVTDNGICHIWSLAANGTVEDKWNVKTIAGFPAIDKCWALMTNNDGTAWVSAEVTSTATHYLTKVNLVSGARIGAVMTPSNAITGMSKDPTTGQVWASSTANSSVAGLYKLDLSTGTLSDRLNTTSLTGGGDIWDIAFDSSGRLWMSVWESHAELASIVPTAVSPLTTYYNAGVMMLAGTALDSDALWFPPAQATPSPTASPALASTGVDDWALAVTALTGTILLVIGSALVAVRRARH